MKSIISLSLFLLLTLSSFAVTTPNAAVAKVDYGEIGDLLEKVVLNMPGNEALRDRYYASEQAEQDAQEKMQAAIMKGEGFDPSAAAISYQRNREDKQQVEQLCQKYLLAVIERVFEDKYDLIFKDEYRSSLLYTRSAIDDVTIVLKQELLKELPESMRARE